MPTTLPDPLPPGTAIWDGLTVVELEQVDESDEYQPYLYLLSDGDRCWVPAENHRDGRFVERCE